MVLKPLKRSLMRLGILHDDRPIGKWQLKILSRPEELENSDLVPTELKYVFTKDPSLRKAVKELLSKHPLGLGVRTTIRTPERVVLAIERVSRFSQHNCITTWLRDLIQRNIEPLITPADEKFARSEKINLREELNIIKQYRGEYKRIMIIHQDNKPLTSSEQKLLDRMNAILDPVESEFAVRSMIFDSAHARTEIAQAIIKSLIIVGPITHVLEKFSRGIGKLFAASVDDLMTETAEFFALRSAGFSWKEIWKRAYILVPVFILATWGILSVEHFIQQDRYVIAGLLFGFGAVALSLTTAIQSIFMFHKRVKTLHGEKKIHHKHNLWKEALIQDFTNPARVGLFIGAIASPTVAAIVFNGFPHLVHNGWVLALLGSTETIVAGIAVIYARKISGYRFKRRLDKMIN